MALALLFFFFAVIRESIKNWNSNLLANIAITRQSYRAISSDTWGFTRWRKAKSINVHIAIMHATTRWVSRALCLSRFINLTIFTGKPTETCPEDQQASRQVHVRVRLLPRRVDAPQNQLDEGISITPTTGAQRDEKVLRRRHEAKANHKKVNCKEINFISSRDIKANEKNYRKLNLLKRLRVKSGLDPIGKYRERRKINEIRDVQLATFFKHTANVFQ